MHARIRSIYGGFLLALAASMAVLVPDARSEPLTALYIVLFGLAGVLYLASSHPPAGFDRSQFRGAGEVSLGLAFFVMVVGGTFGPDPWWATAVLGTLVGVSMVWIGVQRVRGVTNPGASWPW
ncbi:hypothetical protein [Haloarchaeobius sp. TZWSO28]|uniref:hypothetical protein n=1 Tax=Haloarchaeobius sp. TZWSO28 TaxID=3446119 RepID=UPI003EC0CABA